MSSPRTAPIIVWFRQDLRLADNPALHAAIETGRPILPLFILDDEGSGEWPLGGASRWWLHHSLAALGADLKRIGSKLLLRKGKSDETVRALISESGAEAVFWNRCYEPQARQRDTELKSALKDEGLDVQSFNSALLVEPWTVKNKSGDPFRVFSPFWRSVRADLEAGQPIETPQSLPAPQSWPKSDSLDDWQLLPRNPDWAEGIAEVWTPGETGAHQRLIDFLEDGAAHYAAGRDRPDKPYTSRLSPYLRFGEISPRQILSVSETYREKIGDKNTEKFFSEIGWREFSYNLLFHFPHFPDRNYQDKFDRFPWSDNAEFLHAWQRGETGYPIVDAGMRELWQTGWMHNRVRMIAASFLIKHLMIDWREGERWFWDTLVDADLANNSASWQWVAGSGADAAPYFRIFNPITQGEKFDPDGDYVRKWVPEIARLPNQYLNKPWEAGPLILKEAGIELGSTYPEPIVDHAAARERALDAFKSLKEAA